MTPLVLGHTALGTTVARALHAARAWAVASQQIARRNAMIAATACARRRAQREEIDEYVRASHPRRTPEHHDPVASGRGLTDD